MATKKIPVKYVGNRLTWTDTVYGSGTKFTRGKITHTPDWAAGRLLKHPEFEDARPVAQRGTPIIADRQKTEAEIEAEKLEMQAVHNHVRLDTMSREQMSAYAKRTFGINVDASAPKADVTGTVRGLMMSRGLAG